MVVAVVAVRPCPLARLLLLLVALQEAERPPLTFSLPPLLACVMQCLLRQLRSPDMHGTLLLPPHPSCCAKVISLLLLMERTWQKRQSQYRSCSWKLRCADLSRLPLQAAAAVPVLPAVPVLARQLRCPLQTPQRFSDEPLQRRSRGTQMLLRLLTLQAQRSDPQRPAPSPCCQLLPLLRQRKLSRGRSQRRSERRCAASTAGTLPSLRCLCLPSLRAGTVLPVELLLALVLMRLERPLSTLLQIYSLAASLRVWQRQLPCDRLRWSRCATGSLLPIQPPRRHPLQQPKGKLPLSLLLQTCQPPSPFLTSHPSNRLMT